MSRVAYRIALVIAPAFAAAPAASQQIAFQSDLPRVMVFLQEDGVTAGTILTRFLVEAGFEVVDPTFAKSAAEQERARKALAGDDVEATALGRDLGAQVIILGAAPAEAVPSPVDASLQTGTAQLTIRALRLDDPRVISSGSTSGRSLDATPSGARTKAVEQAAEALLYQSAFLGDVATDWETRPWQNRAYWQPQPGSVPAQFAPPAAGGTTDVRIAIVESDVYAPAEASGERTRGTRGFAISQQPGRMAQPSDTEARSMRARVRGLVSDPAARVEVGGVAARTRSLSPDERQRYGIDAGGWFEAEVPVTPSQDTLRVRAHGAGGTTETLVRPRIGRRWAVIIGISDYADKRISQLRYADDDARAIYRFLRSPVGGEIPASRITMLLNDQATSAAIRDALFIFLQQAEEHDLVLVYVASHGAPDPSRPANLYILSHDTDVERIAATAFPMWDFKTALRRQIAAERVVVIADACHSGGALVDDANPIGGSFAELFSPSRRVTLSAADAEELSREGDEWGGGHGVFTHLLLEGLNGAADADRDGVVTFSEVALYVKNRVPAETDGEQNPQRAGLGDVPLAGMARDGTG